MIYNTLYRTDGISNSDRMNNPLAADSFRIHELSMEEFVTCSRYYGRNINYFNMKNAPEGTWADCFCNDEISVLSDIKCFEMTEFVKNSRILLRDRRKTSNLLHDIISSCVKIIMKIDSWYLQLSAIDTPIAALAAHTVGNLIRECSGSLVGDILELVKIYNDTPQKVEEPVLKALWSREKNDDGNTDRLTLCRVTVVSLHSLVMSIKKNTAIFIDESLGRSDHSAETGMFLAFIELLRNVQDEINKIPEKYIRYYYENILQFRHRSSLPEKVFITVLPNSSIKDDIVIKPGTGFIAEHDGTREIYESSSELIVKNAVISSVYTMTLHHDTYTEPEKTLGFYSGIEIKECCSDSGESKKSEFQVFGGAVNGKSALKDGRAARCGFAIASKALYLAEGERTVRLQMCMNNNLDERWSAEFKSKLTAGMVISDENVKELDMDSLFLKVLNSLFVIELTSAQGWYGVVQYSIVLSSAGIWFQDNSITLEFVIPVNAPSIIAYDETIHGSGYTTKLPICKITFNNDAEIYPYSMIEGLSLNSVHIDVDVARASDLLLYNQYGALNADSPFMPFGPMPSKGDYLVIGSYEMANKNVDLVDIHIEWANVPWHENGFRGYYSGYKHHFDNNTFKVSISELKDGTWIRGNEERCSRILLFETENSEQSPDKSGKISSRKHFKDIPLNCMLEKDVMTDKKLYNYTCKSKDGFLRIELTDPFYGFGHILYADETSSTLISQILSKKKISLPQQPFIPVINEIRICYRAHTTINFSHVYPSGTDLSTMDAFFHVYPLGIHHLYPVNEIDNVTVIPQLDRIEQRTCMDGNLMIGIRGAKPCGPVSLHFMMGEEMLTKKTSKIVWSYLKQNRWIEIEPVGIIEDTTCGLEKTGTVTINIPQDIENNQTVMPELTYWLRASTNENIDAFGTFTSISLNGVMLTEKQNEKNSRINRRLPEGSVREPAATIPGVDSVIQQGISFGGKSHETDKEFVTRISERLRHKNRVVSFYDYEHVVMDAFPEIMKVKCFPNMISADAKFMHPGNVLIAVVAWPRKNDDDGSINVMLNGNLLNEIEKHLRKLSPAGAKIEVINPVYEEIQLRCAIALKRNVSHTNAVCNVNRAVSEYISPWDETGNKSCFGWKIRLSEVEQFLRTLPQVDHVTDFSMLQKTTSGTRKYSLYDSADEAEGSISERCIYPQVPWSICIPFRYHAIEIMADVENRKPAITGISKADVGNILIVKGKNGYGSTEPKNT